MEKVTVVGDRRSGQKYAFVKFKHHVSVPYTLQLMNGIRLYDQPLRLKERNGSGNTGSVEAVPPQPLMGPPTLVPPLPAARPSFVMMRPPSLVAFNPNVSGGHAGLLRSFSEPEGLGTNFHESRRTGTMARDRERSAGPYSRPHMQQRPSQGILAQNIASQLYMLNQASAASQRNPHYYARTSHSNPQRQQNHHSHKQFNDHSGFRR